VSKKLFSKISITIIYSLWRYILSYN
jgi:hypothetical protein